MRRVGSLTGIIKWSRAERWSESRDVARLHCVGRFAGLQVQSSSHIVVIHDLSNQGVCIDAPDGLSIGAPVQVISDKRKRMGRVAWLRDGRAGIVSISQPRWSDLLK